MDLDDRTEVDVFKSAVIRGDVQGIRNCLTRTGLTVNQALIGTWSPLMYCCSLGHSDAVKCLLENGGDANFSPGMCTPLICACTVMPNLFEHNNYECVQLLLKSGAEVNRVDHQKMTCLMHAARNGYIPIARKLIESKADVNLVDEKGWTALFWAVNEDQVEIVQHLLLSGADVNIKDAHGMTPYSLAERKGLAMVTDLLMSFAEGNWKQATRHSDIEITNCNDDEYDRCFNRMTQNLSLINNNVSSAFQDDVTVILLNLEMSNVSHLLKKQNVGLSWFLSLTNDQLVNLGVSLPYERKKILDAIKEFHLYSWKLSVCQIRSTEATYDLPDTAIDVANVMRQLCVLHGTVAYVRHQLQDKTLLETLKRAAYLKNLHDQAHRILVACRPVKAELSHFLYYVKMLDKQNYMIPADLLVVGKRKWISRYTKAALILTCILGSIALLKNRKLASGLY